MENVIRLVLIGALPPPIGGTTVLFKQLEDDLREHKEIETITINTTRKCKGVLCNIWHGSRVLFEIFRDIREVRVVSFHASINAAICYGPLIWFVCKSYRIKWIFRGFGEFAKSYSVKPKIMKWIFRNTVLKADIVLFETKISVNYFKSLSCNRVEWYANSRKTSLMNYYKESKDIGDRLKFIYVGHVNKSKGIHDLITAGEVIGTAADIDIDVYGPMQDGISINDFKDKKTKYCGLIPPENVRDMIHKYDILVLPTRCKGEGYPGVILEAFSVGVPVIATNIGGIPEIVENNKNGILIEPFDVDQLINVMKKLIESPNAVDSMSIEAFISAEKYSSGKWSAIFATFVCDLANAVHSNE